MSDLAYKSEIRDSVIQSLLEKVRKRSYESYLVSVRLGKIRLFRGVQINFDFPVTALIGPNGGGKSTILGASACIFDSIIPENIFPKSRIGDEAMDDWRIEYSIVDKRANPKGPIQAEVTLRKNKWSRSHAFSKHIKIFGISRTVPAIENPLFALKKKLSVHGHPRGSLSISTDKVDNIDHIKREAERILGKSLANFRLIQITYSVIKKRQKKKRQVASKEILEDTKSRNESSKKISTYTQKQYMYLGNDGENNYSEFNFGSGEASVIRMIADIESLPDCSLVLIEEIENGLHPLAIHRTVEYLMEVAKRKSIQVIFTTHSDYALAPLPSEAIWASFDGKLQQGKLSVEVVRAVSGRIDK